MPIRITHCYNGLTDYGSVAANQATYLGTFFTNSGASNTSYQFGGGSIPAAFFLWNAYNRVAVTATTYLTGSWSVTSNTTREVAGNGNARCFFVSGMAEDGITASYTIRSFMPQGFYEGFISNLDSTTVSTNVSLLIGNVVGANNQDSIRTNTSFVGQVGFHFVTPLEAADGSDTVTVFGDTWMGLTVKLRM